MGSVLKKWIVFLSIGLVSNVFASHLVIDEVLVEHVESPKPERPRYVTVGSNQSNTVSSLDAIFAQESEVDLIIDPKAESKRVAYEEEMMRAYRRLKRNSVKRSIPLLEQAQKKFEEFKAYSCDWKKSLSSNQSTDYDQCVIELIRWRAAQLRTELKRKK